MAPRSLLDDVWRDIRIEWSRGAPWRLTAVRTRPVVDAPYHALMDIRHVRYDHPDAVRLTELVQQEYVERYGSPDATPVDPGHFDPPRGLFLVAYSDDGRPLATGGWRARDVSADGFR